MEEDVGLVLVFSSATDLPPAVAGVHKLLGMTVQEAEYPDTNPTSEEDKEQKGAEDIRAGPVHTEGEELREVCEVAQPCWS